MCSDLSFHPNSKSKSIHTDALILDWAKLILELNGEWART